MRASQRTGVAYNVQIAGEAKHKVMVEPEGTNAVTDQAQLSPLAGGAKQPLGVEELNVGADQGDYDGHAVKQCLGAGITAYLAKPQTSATQQRGLYTQAAFPYEAVRDV